MTLVRTCAVGSLVLASGVDARPAFAQAGLTTRVSVSSTGQEGNNDSSWASTSADGRFVAFESRAYTLVPGDGNGSVDVFVHDRHTGNTTLISASSAGVQGWDNSYAPSISADGRFVAFWSSANNLVSGDTGAADDIFIRDRITGETTRISVDSSGAEGWDDSRECSISATGRMVAFHSEARNLVAGDTNGVRDVFVRDRQTSTTTRISVSSSGTQGNNHSGWYSTHENSISISPDGRFVAFTSAASTLVTGDTNAQDDVFLRDRDTDNDGIYDETNAVATIRISVSTAGVQGNNGSDQPSIAAGGRFVVFRSHASNLVSNPNDTNGASDVFLRDRDTDSDGIFDEPSAVSTTRISASSGTEGNGSSHLPSISGDGRMVAFQSWASNLVPGDTNGCHDIFVYERLTQTITRASLGHWGQASQNCEHPSISGDGRFVAFETAGSLVPEDLNGALDVYVRDRLTSPSLCTQSSPISRTYVVGDATPQLETRAVSLCAGPQGNVSWSVLETPPTTWLTVVPYSGTLTASVPTRDVTVLFQPSGLPVGTHTTTLVFRNNNYPDNLIQVPVTLTVLNAATADLDVQPSSIPPKLFTVGGAFPGADILTVSNLGTAGTMLNWTLTESPPAPWLNATPMTGAAVGGQSNSVVVSYTPLFVPVGQYNTTLRFRNTADATDRVDIPVQLTVLDGSSGSGANTVQFGGLTVHADQIVYNGNMVNLSGNVSIENVLGVSGTAQIDQNAHLFSTSGTMTLLTGTIPVPLLSGSILLSEAQSRLSVSPGAGLNYLLNVGGLRVEINRIDVYISPQRGIGIGGRLVLPSELGGLKVDINNLTWLDPPRQFAFNGVVALPDVTLLNTGWVLRGMILSLDSDHATYSGTGSFVSSTPPLTINGGGTIVNGALQSVSASYSGTPVPMGGTPVALKEIGASITGFVSPPLVLAGTIEVATVPSLPVGPYQISVLTADAGVELSSSWYVQMTGSTCLFRPSQAIQQNVFGWEFDYDGIPLANAVLRLDPTGFRGAAEVNFLDVLVGRSFVTIDGDPAVGVININGSLDGTVQIPAGWPLGPASLGSSSTQFCNEGVVSTGYIGPFTVTLRIGLDGTIQFLSGWSGLIPGPGGSLDVPPGTRSMLVRARPLVGTLQEIQALSPGGTVYTAQNSPIYIPDLAATVESAMYMGQIGADGSLYFAVQNPAAGTWAVNLIGQSPVADVSLVLGNEKPRLDVFTPAQDVSGTNVQVDYAASDGDDQASVNFYIDRDGEGFDGLQVGQTRIEIDGNDSAQLDLTNVDPGEYHVVVTVDDGHNAATMAYAPGRVTVAPPTALQSPKNVTVSTQDDGSLVVHWNPVPGAAGYRVGWKAEQCSGREVLVDVGPGAANTTVLEVPIGDRYSVRVTGYEANGRSGLPSPSMPAAARKLAANHEPKFLGEPRVRVREGTSLALPLVAEDLDGDAITYTLNSGPEGMVVNATSGLLTWTPQNGASGTVPAEVQATDSQGAFALRQVEVLLVLASAPNEPPVITNRPSLHAIPGANYTFGVQAIDPEGQPITYQLEEGPEGMSLDQNTGALAWKPTVADVGEHAVALRALDSSTAKARLRFSLVVGAGETSVLLPGRTWKSSVPPGGLASAAFEGIAGAKVCFGMRATTGNLQPMLALVGPDGQAVSGLGKVQAGSGPPFPKSITLPVTGLYRIDIQGRSGSSGGFQLDTSVKVANPIVLSGDIMPGATHDFMFDGMPGIGILEAALEQANTAAFVPELHLFDPTGAEIDLTYSMTTAPTGSVITLSNVPITKLGSWRIQVANNSAGPGAPAAAQLTIAFAKP